MSCGWWFTLKTSTERAGRLRDALNLFSSCEHTHNICSDCERSAESSNYEVEHRDGVGLEGVEDESVYDEAMRTGEIFPDRPVVSPRMNFKLVPEKRIQRHVPRSI